LAHGHIGEHLPHVGLGVAGRGRILEKPADEGDPDASDHVAIQDGQDPQADESESHDLADGRRDFAGASQASGPASGDKWGDVSSDEAAVSRGR
jgi:hypothetical protein